MKLLKSLSLILSGVILLLALGGCVTTGGTPSAQSPDESSLSGQGASSQGNEQSSDQELSGPVEISWGVQRQKTSGENEAYERVAQAYNETNSKGITVTVNFVEYTDSAQWNTWLTSQLIGGVANEVVLSWHIPAIEHYKKGLLVDLKPYLDQPNPYSESSSSWWDNFTDGLVNQNMDSITGVVPSVPLGTTAVKVFYNKGLFERLGITELPATYNELIEICQIIQADGAAPFIVANQSPNDDHFNWFHRMFMDQTIEPLIDDIDLTGNGVVELNEICAAYDKGLINLEDPRWAVPLPILKEFSQYWYPGYNGLDKTTANDLFIRQDGAMIMAVGHTLKTYIENPDLDFEIGFFSFPYLTKENTEYAVEKPYEMGGAPQNNMCIPASASGDKLTAAIDFLQFLSSEKGAALLAEGLWWTPPFKEVKSMPDAMAGMYIEGSTSKLRLLAPQTDQLLYQDDTKLGQLFLEGKITAEEFSASLNEDLKTSVEALKQSNDWNEANNWGFNP